MATREDSNENSDVTPTKSSDLNNSLVKKVTSLIPSSISKWFGKTKLLTRRRDSDSDDDSFIIEQPPSKRARRPSDFNYSAGNSTYLNGSVSNARPQANSTEFLNNIRSRQSLRYNSYDSIFDSNVRASSEKRESSNSIYDDPEPGPSGLQPTPVSNVNRMAKRTFSGPTTGSANKPILVNGEKKTDSGGSTSGCSSMAQRNAKVMLLEEELPQSTETTAANADSTSTINAPSANKKNPGNDLNNSTMANQSTRSLFTEHLMTTRPAVASLASRRPSFNTSTFGSPSLVDRTLSTERVTNSPFYSGRTMFGGASAYRRIREHNTPVTPIRNSIKIKPANDTAMNNNSASLSQTARRILDALEHFSSPLNDARKIPRQNLSSKKLSEESQRSTMPRTPYSRDTSSRIRELNIPTVPDLLLMKRRERLQDSTFKTRQTATSSNSELNKEVEYKLRADDDETKQKHSNKMKNKISKVRTKTISQTPMEQLNLLNVALPITTLPKFDLSLPKPLAPVQTALPSLNTQKATVDGNKSPVVTFLKSPTNDYNFKFAPPINIGKGSCLMTINNFKFSNPIVVREVDTFTFKSPSSPVLKRKSIKVNGDVDMFKPAPVLKTTGSVMDVLGKNNSLDKFKPSPATWECDLCMIRNKPDVEKCVACETLKPKPRDTASLSTMPTSTGSSSFGTQFKISSDKWECNVCMVRNNNTDDKCVACTTARPGGAVSTPVSTTSPMVTGVTTWECSVCMIRNKLTLTKCEACETPKNSNSVMNSASSPKPFSEKPKSSQFGTPFVKKSSEWECPSCMVRNPSLKMKCACCEAPQPGMAPTQKGITLPTTTQFKFGIDKADVKSPETSSGTTFGEKSTAPPLTAGFSFGGTAAPVPTTGFTFGIPAQKSVDVKEESRKRSADAVDSSTVKKQSPPNISGNSQFTIGSSDQSKTGASMAGFKFGAQTDVNKNSDKSTEVKTSSPKATPIFNFASSQVSPKSSTFGVVTSTTTTTNTTTTANANLFTFGTPTVANASISKSNNLSSSNTQVTTSTASIVSFGNTKDNPNSSSLNAETPKLLKSPSGSGSEAKKILFGAPSSSIPAFGESASTTPLFGQIAASTNKASTTPAFEIGQPLGGTNASSFSNLNEIKHNSPATTTTTITFGSTTVMTTAASTFSTSNPMVSFGNTSASGAAPLFGPSTLNKKPDFVTTNTPTFGAVSAVIKPPAAFESTPFPANVPLSFGVPTTTSTNSSIFGTNATTTSSVFGGTTTTPAFGLTSATPTFGNTASSGSTFGGSATFGKSSNQPPTFGSNTSSSGNAPATFASVLPSNGFTFGSKPEDKPTAAPFTFGGNSDTGSTPAKVPAFPFAANTNFEFGGKQSTHASQGFNFKAAPTFGVGSSGTNTFSGANPTSQSTTANPSFGTAASSTPSSGFNFGSATAPPAAMFSFGNSNQGPSGQTGTPGGFAFGTSQQPAVSTATTAPAPPTFNPNTKPTFNFSGGAGPTAFTAQATPGMSVTGSNPGRKIKKAVRRHRVIP